MIEYRCKQQHNQLICSSDTEWQWEGMLDGDREMQAMECFHIVSAADQKKCRYFFPRETRWHRPAVQTSAQPLRPSVTGENIASWKTRTAATLRSAPLGTWITVAITHRPDGIHHDRPWDQRTPRMWPAAGQMGGGHCWTLEQFPT